MRVTNKKSLNTYYNRSYVDEPQEFNEPSLTNPIYEPNCDINYLISTFNGAPRTPVYGEQSDWTFEDWENEKALIKQQFNHLTPEMKQKFGSPAEFFKYCANPENYMITDTGLEEVEHKEIKLNNEIHFDDPDKEKEYRDLMKQLDDLKRK